MPAAHLTNRAEFQWTSGNRSCAILAGAFSSIMLSRCRPAKDSECTSGPRFAIPLILVLTGILICFAPQVSHAACIGPPALTAKLKAKPTAQGHADLGNWFAAKKDFECAARSFAVAAKLQPESLGFQYLWGLSLHSAGHDGESLAPLRRAERLDPGDVRPHLALGAALDSLKRFQEAEGEWRAALAIDAESDPALDALSQDLLDQKDYTGVITLLGKSGSTRLKTTQQSLNLGVAYASSAQLHEADKVLREGLNNAPDSLPIANELAIVLMLLSRSDETFAVFDLALSHHPEDLPTQILYLRTMITSHSGKAPGFAQKLLSSHPDQWEVLYLNALVASTDGDFERARQLVARSVELHPDDPAAQKLLGSTLDKVDDVPGARAHIEKAIALGDNSAETHYELAKVLQKLGDSQRAREELQRYQKVKSAQSAKNQAAGKAEEADQAMANGDPARAVVLYRDALNSDPDEPLLHYKLAKALEKTNDVAGEKAALTRAIELDPNLAEAQNQMGFLLVREGDAAQAEERFRAAIKASPSYVAAWINLAATLASETKWQDAKQTIHRALEIDPDNEQARRLNEAINAAYPVP